MKRCWLILSLILILAVLLAGCAAPGSVSCIAAIHPLISSAIMTAAINILRTAITPLLPYSAAALGSVTLVAPQGMTPHCASNWYSFSVQPSPHFLWALQMV